MDGDYDRSFYYPNATFRCAHTNDASYHWFKFAFGFEALVESVELHNRVIFTERFSDVLIYIQTSSGQSRLCGNTSDMTNIDIRRIHCAEALTGNAMKLVKNKTEVLTICEMDIYGFIL